MALTTEQRIAALMEADKAKAAKRARLDPRKVEAVPAQPAASVPKPTPSQQSERIEIKPQPGPQEKFLSTSADICLYGGSAGSGKTFSLVLEPLRHVSNPLFNGIIFRRQGVMVRNPGGLWDESRKLYPLVGAVSKEISMQWTFPSGSPIRFAHLEHPSDVLGYQGAQIVYLGFDELTHFEETQFIYMLSRLRSLSGVKPYVRATCNPDSESWVRSWVDWWIGPDGFPIPERSGVLRWFVRLGDALHWADTKQELIERFGPDVMPMSFTFISAKLTDNPILLKADPNYKAKLLALDRVNRERLLDGNWDTKPSAGMYFRREWFEVVERVPDQTIKSIRYWDRAATKPSETNRDPDWTVGLKFVKLPNKQWVITDIRRIRESALKVEQFILATAGMDGIATTIWLEEDPGAAGKADIANILKLLNQYHTKVNRPTKDKITRALPVSSQCEAGNVKILKGAWNAAFFSESENFPDGKHDDQVDALSGAYTAMSTGTSMFDVLG